MMKRIQHLLIIIGLTVSSTAMASMSTSQIRSEARFLTDKMAYEMNLTTSQYNDIYEINYDFMYSIGTIIDYVVRGEEWAMDDYYEALDVRNDDLRWILNDLQYRRFMGIDYFYRPIYVNGGNWSLRVYANYPNRRMFYFGTPYHYRTYCGAHYRPHFHHGSYYQGRYPQGGHYPSPHRMRNERAFHSYRRSDFGSVRFRPNTSARPNYAPTRPSVSTRPSMPTRPNGTDRPGSSRPSVENRPGRTERPNRETAPNRGQSGNRGESNRSSSRRSESDASSFDAGRRSSGSSVRTERSRISGSSSERRSPSESARSSRSSSRSSERESNGRR